MPLNVKLFVGKPEPSSRLTFVRKVLKSSTRSTRPLIGPSRRPAFAVSSAAIWKPFVGSSDVEKATSYCRITNNHDGHRERQMASVQSAKLMS